MKGDETAGLLNRGPMYKAVYILLMMVLLICCLLLLWTGAVSDDRLRETTKVSVACQQELEKLKERIKQYEFREQAQLKAEREARKANEEARGNDPIIGQRLRQLVKELPCWVDTNEWVARMEGVARIPSGDLRRAIKKEGPPLTRDQLRRLRAAYRTSPMPECVNKALEEEEVGSE